MPPRRIAWACAALGFGLGGLLDVAVFHLLLQWHHFVMAGDAATRLRADGAIMLALLGVALLGVVLLWRAAPAAAGSGRDGARRAWGGALLGAGAFNGGDVLLDHFVLRLHRLHEGASTMLPDLAWLALSVALLGAGAWLARGARRETTRPGRTGAAQR